MAEGQGTQTLGQASSRAGKPGALDPYNRPGDIAFSRQATLNFVLN